MGFMSEARCTMRRTDNMMNRTEPMLAILDAIGKDGVIDSFLYPDVEIRDGKVYITTVMKIEKPFNKVFRNTMVLDLPDFEEMKSLGLKGLAQLSGLIDKILEDNADVKEDAADGSDAQDESTAAVD